MRKTKPVRKAFEPVIDERGRHVLTFGNPGACCPDCGAPAVLVETSSTSADGRVTVVNLWHAPVECCAPRVQAAFDAVARTYARKHGDGEDTSAEIADLDRLRRLHRKLSGTPGEIPRIYQE